LKWEKGLLRTRFERNSQILIEIKITIMVSTMTSIGYTVGKNRIDQRWNAGQDLESRGRTGYRSYHEPTGGEIKLPIQPCVDLAADGED
jgi:hypothetical protein